MRTALTLLAAVVVLIGLPSCGNSGSDNSARGTTERSSADFFDAGTRDGFESDAHIQARRTEAFDLSQEVLGLNNSAGAYAPDAQWCAAGKAMRPMVARMAAIIGELDTLGAADTSEFYGTQLVDRARDSLRSKIQFC